MKNLEVESTDADDEFFDFVYKSLDDRRYLIVLYDLWSTYAWDILRKAFPYNENRSRIILTTRDPHVADRASDHTHMMSYLDEDETWDLLRENIFEGDPCPSQLESMGKTIARRCGGHQLSVKLISVVLGDDQTEAVWEDIAGSIDSLMHDHRLKQIFYVSYTHLPHHLRPCYLYLASFPEGRQIYVSRLVKLWVAEGFLDESGCRSAQETGEEHVEYLFRRRLVSMSKRKSYGIIKTITIHESMRHWCKTKPEKNILVFKTGPSNTNGADG